MSKIKNGGLDQCGAEPCEQQQFGTAGAEGVKDGEYSGVGRHAVSTCGLLSHLVPPCTSPDDESAMINNYNATMAMNDAGTSI